MTRHVDADGIAAIKRWEGRRLTAYQDTGGVWTIGYGHTSRAGPPTVRQGMAISEADAETILRRDLLAFERAVEKLVRVPLSDPQFAALVSFAFNVGPAALARSSLLRKLNAGDYEAVPRELMRWVNDDGKRIQGLVNRRAAEAGLWAKGAFVSSAGPTSPKPKPPPVITKESVSWLATLIATLGSAVTSGPMQVALAVVVVIAAVTGAYLLLKSRREAAT